LVLFGLESERVHVDTSGRDVGVVLVRLDPVEVVSVTDSESVVAVELDECGDNRVVTGHTFHTGYTVTRFQHGAVPPVGEVEGLLTLPGVDDGVIARHEGIALDDPDEFLTRVVEVQLDLVGGRSDGFTSSELEGIDQVFVGHLGELTTFISIEVDVVHVEGGCNQTSVGDTVADDVGVGGDLRSIVPAHVAEVVELEVDTHFVVLESDQREGQTRVAVEPELERDVEGVFRSTLLDFIRSVGGTGRAVGVAVFTSLDEGVDELGDVTNHLGITGLLTRFLGKFIPDVEPVTVLLIDTLSSDFDFNVFDDVVTGPVEPAELGSRTIRGLEGNLGESGLEVHTVDQITITLDGACDLLTEVGGSVERIFNGFHGKVGVTTVHHLEECDLGVTCEVNILGSVSYELHQTTTCHLCLYPSRRKKF
jgi:hypothetical protein